MSVSAYPNTAAIGAQYLKYKKHPPDYDSITIPQKFEDAGADMLVTAASPPQVWDFEYGGLDDTQAKVLDDHYASAGGQALGFSFTEPRNEPFTTTGSTYTDTHYLTYERDHDKYWNQVRRVTLIKRPA